MALPSAQQRRQQELGDQIRIDVVLYVAERLEHLG